MIEKIEKLQRNMKDKKKKDIYYIHIKRQSKIAFGKCYFNIILYIILIIILFNG